MAQALHWIYLPLDRLLRSPLLRLLSLSNDK